MASPRKQQPTRKEKIEAEDAKLGCTPLRIGVSSCLLGEPVRYDGGHKHDRYLTDTIGRMVEFVPVCPELEIGLGVPRPTIRLVADADAPGGVRLVCPDSGEDLTARMIGFAKKKAAALEGQDLSGYVLKSKSPTCGMERVKVYDRNGVPGRSERGVYAAVLMERLADLPVEEEGRLNDPVLRENFFERVFGRKRISDFFRSRWSIGDLVRFHTLEKFTLLSHDPAAYRRLGQIVAAAKGTPRAELERTYRREHFEAMKKRATRKKHTDVLQHLSGHLKKDATDDERKDLAQEILDYREGLVPRIVPLTILRHLARRYGATYVLEQHYMSPHPRELMLQNHV